MIRPYEIDPQSEYNSKSFANIHFIQGYPTSHSIVVELDPMAVDGYEAEAEMNQAVEDFNNSSTNLPPSST